MAIPFNTPVQPTPDPEYLRWSKPIASVPADTSKEVALKGTGKLLDEGVTAIDTGIKKGIARDVDTQVDQIRDEYTHNLQLADASINKDDAQTLLPANTTAKPIPKQLENVVRDAATLESARQRLTTTVS